MNIKRILWPLVLLACSSLITFSTADSRSASPNNITNPIQSQTTSQISSVESCGGFYAPTADSTVYQDDPATPHGDDPFLQVNRNVDPSSGTAYTYLAFDLGDSIPDEAIIHSAELELTLSQPADPPEFLLQLVGSPQEWDESTLTWDFQPAWRHVYEPKSYHLIWNESDPVVLRVDVSTLVNLWVTDVYTPTGLALIPAESPIHIAFYSRDTEILGPRLVVHCSPSPLQLPQSYEHLNERQLAGIERLSAMSSSTPTFQIGESGAIRFALFDILAPAEMPDSISQAFWFTEAFSDVLRLTDPMQDLQFVRSSEDEANIFFRQRYAGIPVIGSEIGIHLIDDHITGLSGSYLSDLLLNPLPQIPAERAHEIALAIANTPAKVISDDQLRLLNRNLFGPWETRTFLTWLVVLDLAGGTEYYIDANTGILRFQQPRSLEGFDLDIETGNNHSPTDGYCHMWWWTDDDDHWCNENGCNSNADTEGLAAYSNAKTIYSFWKSYLNRDSYDNDGSEIQIYVHVGTNWLNAHWTCNRMEFGDGYAVLDVIGHEFTHGVTDKTSDLVYKNESGALNESFSDIFGTFVDYNDWLHCEDCPGGASRSLEDPTLYGDPDLYSDYVNTTDDYGGVHTNSGIHNKAAYLVTTGDDFNGVDLPWGGIGLYRARHLFYNTLTRLTSNAGLEDARNAAVATAKELFQQNQYGFTSTHVCTVRNAYHAVELGDGDIDCDGVEDTTDTDDDGDKIPDSKDNCTEEANTDQKDTDKDGQGDECDTDDDADTVLDITDNCELVSNSNQLDTDGDGYGDACDDNDDNDFLPDDQDNCPTESNYDQLDTDGDGYGDECDDDDDNDGVADIYDNCDLVQNANQANSDGDPFGDACDLCPDFYGEDNGDPDNDGKGNSCDDDDDNDGVLDGNDNCPEDSNADQYDLDGDGSGWACDEDDADELLAKMKTLLLQYHEGYPIRIPLPGCGVCGPGYIDPGYYQKINLISNGDFHALIVDSSGNVIAQTSSGPVDLLNQSLTYRLAPYASHIVSVTAGFSNVQGIFLPADSVRYYLELYPALGLDLSKQYSMDVYIEEGFTQTAIYTYLPTLTK